MLVSKLPNDSRIFDDPINLKLIKMMYEGEANSIVQWQRYSECLKIAADNILTLKNNDPYRILPNIYKLLFGLSIENMIKGIFISIYKLPIKNGNIKWPGNSHDLLNLIDYINKPITLIKFSKNERIILTELSDYIKWGGRYPVPINFQSLIPKRKGNSESYYLVTVGISDKEIIDYDKLYNKLEENILLKVKEYRDQLNKKHSVEEFLKNIKKA